MAAKYLSATFALLGAVAISDPALAFRCGNGLVSTGDQEFEVTKKCGAPVSSEWIVADPWGAAKKAVYDTGGGRFYKIVIFSNDRIVDIKDGPRN